MGTNLPADRRRKPGDNNAEVGSHGRSVPIYLLGVVSPSKMDVNPPFPFTGSVRSVPGWTSAFTASHLHSQAFPHKTAPIGVTYGVIRIAIIIKVLG